MTPEEIKALQDKLTKAEADLASSQKLNESLKGAIVDQEKVTAPAATGNTITSLLPDKPVTVDKKKYNIVFPKFIYKSTVYTAYQLAKDEALLKELIKIGFGGLEEVV